MEALLAWLEGSALGHAIRSSGVWTYGLLNLVHILGLSTLFGSVVALDLKLLGLWRRVPLTAIATPTVPLAAAGFVVAALSGTAMITTNAGEYLGNPFLLVKFPAIALALVNVVIISRVPAWRARALREPEGDARRLLAILGGISLACWLAAVGAGRMIGYW